MMMAIPTTMITVALTVLHSIRCIAVMVFAKVMKYAMMEMQSMEIAVLHSVKENDEHFVEMVLSISQMKTVMTVIDQRQILVVTVVKVGDHSLVAMAQSMHQNNVMMGTRKMEMGVVNVVPMKLLSIKMKTLLARTSLIKKMILHEASEMDHQLTLRKILAQLTV